MLSLQIFIQNIFQRFEKCIDNENKGFFSLDMFKYVYALLFNLKWFQKM